MLTSSSFENVYLAVGPTDLRKSIDGLSIIVKQHFKLDPFSNALFVFCNKKKDKIKCLRWDNNGFWIYYKRLEKGCFRFPDKAENNTIAITERQFRWLLDGLALDQKRAHPSVIQRGIY